MSISHLPTRETAAAAALAAVRGAREQLSEVAVWQLGDAELLRSTEALYQEVAALNAQTLRLLAEVDQRGLAPDAGSRSTLAWVMATAKVRRGAAHTQVTLANRLGEFPATAAALGAGSVSVDQAEVITKTLTGLPATVEADQVVAAEASLLEQAGRFGPATLAKLGEHLRYVLDQDGKEPDESEPADPGYFLNLRTHPDGSCAGEFHLDPVTALTLTRLVEAGAAPRPSTVEGKDLRNGGRRRADAFADLVFRAGADREPVPGMGRPTIAVTMSLQELRDGLPVLGPDHQTFTASTIRRIACDAHVIPVVLGSESEVLDVGRAARTIPVAIRRALIVRDKQCAFPACTMPANMTQAHHIRHWSRGGLTELINLVLLCGHHHDTIHHRGWTVHIDDGLPAFTPPPWLTAA